MGENQQPIFILPEGYKRQMGKDAQRSNILAAKIVAETVEPRLDQKVWIKCLLTRLETS